MRDYVKKGEKIVKAMRAKAGLEPSEDIIEADMALREARRNCDLSHLTPIYTIYRQGNPEVPGRNLPPQAVAQNGPNTDAQRIVKWRAARKGCDPRRPRARDSLKERGGRRGP